MGVHRKQGITAPDKNPRDLAQGFTTGTATGGYKLTRVDFDIGGKRPGTGLQRGHLHERGAPTVSAVSAKGGQLSVSWSAPTNTNGADILDYDLRYYAGSADPTDEADWVEEGESSGIPNPGASTAAQTISGLSPSTAYQVQVRAANAVGEGAWSDSAARVMLQPQTIDI